MGPIPTSVSLEGSVFRSSQAQPCQEDTPSVMTARAEGAGAGTDTLEFRDIADRLTRTDCPLPETNPRIAMLTPYSGNNLGDAAIQDAMIANLRLRMPGAEFSGISLNCDNFRERHGTAAFPLCATNRPFYSMSGTNATQHHGKVPQQQNANPIKSMLRKIPVLGRVVKKAYTKLTGILQEYRHCVEGYRFLRRHDLLLVSGGGQLDEEWGGAWGHPFTLFKWAMLARAAGVPFAMASVGACSITSGTARYFLSAALRMAQYRSYRDQNSRTIAASLLKLAERDAVVPDAAFSLASTELPPPTGLRSISQGRAVVAISPIIYGKPESWPYQNRALYERYLQQMAKVVSQLLDRGSLVVLLWSSQADRSAVRDLRELLDAQSKQKLDQQAYVPDITTWRDLVSVLLGVDVLIASRLHSAILGFVAQRPTIAISFDPKVDWAMHDLDQSDYLLQIRDFVAEDVTNGLDELERRREAATTKINSYLQRILPAFAPQYDTLAQLAMVAYAARTN